MATPRRLSATPDLDDFGELGKLNIVHLVKVADFP